ncbi:ABC transporter permease [Nakamurella sp. PAMC28650]|jgi:ribose/xylose/arabinose/galactoside ABC-type transport system permease subunit|uniref:ABC transporter permease n=1 Tax=Nakamurella sp. PAMC28650 TaxID=2762325 RepID=UPI00164ECD80|nr:ABC transporter permease [Nakamurella sp. PAMC28650]QNK82227.1 ABC transporter permease [Nakamurella sp. PAMC28650]
MTEPTLKKSDAPAPPGFETVHVVPGPEIGAAARRQRARALTSLVSRNGAVAVLILVMIIGTITVPTFGTADNLRNTALAASFLAIIAAGMTFVIISGGIDLSVGSVYALAVILSADMSKYGSAAAILVPIVACVAVGLLQGVIIAKLGLPPFIVTLAGLTGVRGLVFFITNEGNDHPSVPGQQFFETLGTGSFLTIGNPVWITLVVFAIGWWALNRTAFGQAVQAVGGSDTAAGLMGLPVARVKMSVYAISGLTVGIAGVLSTALSGGGQEARVGNAYELSAIAAVVIGGTLLAGGVGSIVGTLAGITLLYVIQNLIVQGFNLNSYVQQVVSGFFLLIVVVLQALLSRRSAR